LEHYYTTLEETSPSFAHFPHIFDVYGAFIENKLMIEHSFFIVEAYLGTVIDLTILYHGFLCVFMAFSGCLLLFRNSV